jgi:4-hydroxy-4-methyl-2-oxoglutarate aldolase
VPSRPQIITKIDRAPAAQIESLAATGVATVHEAYTRTGLMHGIKPVTGGVTIGGSAVTCLNFAGDNLMLHAALDLAQPGDVLVVGVTAPSTHGMFGELLATSCRARGVTGVILDAAARDVTALREMRFGVWARAISAAGTVKEQPGWVNIPISCGGQVVFPGDAIVADDDGVVVIARADVETVLAGATQRRDREETSRARLASGHSTLDNGNRRQQLAPYIRED